MSETNPANTYEEGQMILRCKGCGQWVDTFLHNRDGCLGRVHQTGAGTPTDDDADKQDYIEEVAFMAEHLYRNTWSRLRGNSVNFSDKSLAKNCITAAEVLVQAISEWKKKEKNDE